MKQRKPVVLKISGQVLGDVGFDSGRIAQVSETLMGAVGDGGRMVVVIGGGNIFRGAQGTHVIEQQDGDHVGMMASATNGMMLLCALAKVGVRARHMSTLGRMEVGRYVEPFDKDEVARFFVEPGILVLSSGTGRPGVSTDSGTIQIAESLGASMVIKGTKVNGLYSADPLKDTNATHIPCISPSEFVRRGFKQIFDLGAVAKADELGIAIRIMQFNLPGNLQMAMKGEEVGSIIRN